MKKYAVAYMNFFDNELTIEFVEAETEKQAIFSHSKMQSDSGWSEELSDNLDEIKQAFFDGDTLVDVKEIKEEG